MSILALWLKRGALSETAGAVTVPIEVVADNGDYIVTDDGLTITVE